MTGSTRNFHANMTIADALRHHPRAGEVLASFHLGGCAHCGINEQETLGEATAGYGVDTKVLVDALNELLD